MFMQMKYIKTARSWNYIKVEKAIKDMPEYQLVTISQESFWVVARLQREVEDDEYEEAKRLDEKYEELWLEKLKSKRKDSGKYCIVTDL